MNEDDTLMVELRDTNPGLTTTTPTLDERAEADRVLRRVMARPPNSPRRVPVVMPVISCLLVLVVVAIALTVGGGGKRAPASAAGMRIVLDARGATPATMKRELEVVRQRVETIFPASRVTLAGADRIVVTDTRASNATPARIVALVTARGLIDVYDWEASVLTPNGKTAASQLEAQDAAAITISQGADSAAPGQPNAGSLPLYQAVELASKQPAPVSFGDRRFPAQYFMFGAPSSAVCKAVARDHDTIPTRGQPCLLAGPVSAPQTTGRNQALRSLGAQLTPGVNISQTQVLAVPTGTIVVQAANTSAGHAISPTSPSAQFYVLRDNVALQGSDITHPQQSVDQSGSPDVVFGLNSTGAKRFHALTASIARRGQEVSGFGPATLNQHFAVVLDGQILTVPSIDFKEYPDGINEQQGLDITSRLTKQSAQDLAAELRFGPLPVALNLAG